MRNTQEIPWRHFWLKNVMLDAGKPLPAKIRRHPITRRMSVSRRLEKLHRMRATLEPPRSWMGVKSALGLNLPPARNINS